MLAGLIATAPRRTAEGGALMRCSNASPCMRRSHQELRRCLCSLRGCGVTHEGQLYRGLSSSQPNITVTLSFKLGRESHPLEHAGRGHERGGPRKRSQYSRGIVFPRERYVYERRIDSQSQHLLDVVFEPTSGRLAASRQRACRAARTSLTATWIAYSTELVMREGSTRATTDVTSCAFRICLQQSAASKESSTRSA